MTTLRDAAQQALGALETVLSDAYHRRFPECCGRPGIECCGNPNEAWTPEDNKIMDLLSPAQRQLSDALRAALAEPAEQEPVAWPHVWGCRANAFGECDKGCTAPQPAAGSAAHQIRLAEVERVEREAALRAAAAAEREADEAAAKREEWRAEMRRDVYGEPN